MVPTVQPPSLCERRSAPGPGVCRLLPACAGRRASQAAAPGRDAEVVCDAGVCCLRDQVSPSGLGAPPRRWHRTHMRLTHRMNREHEGSWPGRRGSGVAAAHGPGGQGSFPIGHRPGCGLDPRRARGGGGRCFFLTSVPVSPSPSLSNIYKYIFKTHLYFHPVCSRMKRERSLATHQPVAEGAQLLLRTERLEVTVREAASFRPRGPPPPHLPCGRRALGWLHRRERFSHTRPRSEVRFPTRSVDPSQ